MQRNRFRAVSVSSCFLTVLVLAGTAFGELTAQQKQLLSTITTRLKAAETNLKAAQDTAGPADGKTNPSAMRLAQSRNATAKAQLDTVKDALKRLPADDPAVKQVADQAQAAEQAIAALDQRLGGGGPAPAAAGGKRLDFKQEKLLKDAEFYLREMEGANQSLKAVVDQVKAAKDPNAIDYRTVAGAMATADKARERKKLTDGYFEQLPKDGAGVAAMAERINQAMAGVEAASGEIAPIHAKLQKMISPEGYPKLNDDLARVQGLGQMTADVSVLKDRPERAVELVNQLAAAKEELAAFDKTYEPLVKQKTDVGQRVSGISSFASKNLAAFDQACAERKQNLPAEIRGELDQANKMADDAARDKKPLFFTGGIPHHLHQAEQKLALYAAIDPQGAPPVAKSVADAREQIKQKQGSLSESIIASNALPPDRYNGADKAALSSRAIEAWKKAQPDAQVLAVRIPSEKWSRETFWRRQNNTWYKIDRSALQAQVVVKHDAKLAATRAINLWIDHLDGDKISAIPLEDAKAAPQPMDLLLLEKVK